MRRFVDFRGPLPLVLAGSAWMAFPGNLPLWRELGSLGLLQSAGGWALAVALAGVIAMALVALLSLLAWRPTLKPAIIFLLVATAVTSHFMLRYNVVIDSGMLVNALQTDRRETAALLDSSVLLTLAVGVLLPAWVAWRWPVRHGGGGRQALRNAGVAALAVVAAVAIILLAFQPVASAMRNHKQLRYMMNPLNSLYAAGSLAAAPLRRDNSKLLPLGRDARLQATTATRPALLVLVVGETARSGNFSLNGYARRTTPELEALRVATFRDAWSCGTSTAASLPCMFSHLGREDYADRNNNFENVLDVLQHAGLGVLWVDNQSGCKGVCDRVAHGDTLRTDKTLCNDGECLDDVLLADLQDRIDALPAQQRTRGVVVVLHQMGSHGPAYWLRSPKETKRFLPECTSINLQDCTREQIVNAYDNSIAQTDRMLAATIAWLKARPQYDTAMVYLSDHGESLGENNIFLHGMPWSIAPDVQKQVPWISWLSPGFEARSGIAMECLRGRSNVRVSHDNLFHSLLGLMQVSTSVYKRPLDAYAECVSP